MNKKLMTVAILALFGCTATASNSFLDNRNLQQIAETLGKEQVGNANPEIQPDVYVADEQKTPGEVFVNGTATVENSIPQTTAVEDIFAVAPPVEDGEADMETGLEQPPVNNGGNTNTNSPSTGTVVITDNSSNDAGMVTMSAIAVLSTLAVNMII